MENEKFVTVLTATYGSEIAVVRGRLESEGIINNLEVAPDTK